MSASRISAFLLLFALLGCAAERRNPGVDSGAGPVDAGSHADGGPFDAALDAMLADASSGDSGPAAMDGSSGADAGQRDAGTADAGPPDAGPPDAGPPDAGPPDAGPPDAGPPDGGCISGAVGTHAARFRWLGSGSGSRAYVRYEVNNLPDTSRWRAGAYGRSISYRPVFADPFLGEGGLDLGGSNFIDVELSTSGLSSIRNVTLAIYGRSFNTTASGSFNWMTFSGSGATPRNFVSNVAPYRWYRADATAAFVPGDDGVLLRIQAGGASNNLVVSRVEICFDAR